ncbi:MAG: hypothetical protein IPN89_08905 [Saprospiraceae bacterium]|nr:hypothetical protein [Saprospiraceae bacterium]
MSQIFWKYKLPDTDEYTVSLYHGDTSGHILLYVGQEIVKIDFSVAEDRSYSFYLGKELFELNIKITKGRIRYLLHNKETNKTIPVYQDLNTRKRHLYKSIVLLLIFLILISLVLHFLM